MSAMPQAQIGEGSKRVESSGKPDAVKAARPVWGWGQGEIPWPTPLVDTSNITTQGYSADDLGQSKVLACSRAVCQLDRSIGIELVQDRFRPSIAVGSVIFCCVDSISARSAIWRGVQSRCDFWADGRMLGEVIRVLAAFDGPSRAYYATTLFAQSGAQVGSCTSRSTIYAAAIAAGLLLHQFTRWLRGMAPERDITLNLLSSDLAIS